MLVRVRSKDGLFRFALEPSDDAALLIAKTLETAPDAEPHSLTFSNQPRGGEMSAASLAGTSLAELGIAHGHLLYAAYTRRAPSAEAGPSSAAAGASVALPSSNGAPSSASAAAAGKKPAAPAPWQTAQEEPVDRFWQAADGKIARPRDQKMCRHGEKAMCDYCMPLEPYDAAYHAEHQIKHLSFNAYLRKQDIAMNKPSQSYIPPLEEADYSVKVPCPSGQHASWPGGICTKCQPSAITLQSQAYRMLDHVEFAHPRLIEHLLAFWRATGTQRFGFLLGRHEAYAEVPMGIKAVVEAIVEPPQEGELDGLTLGVPWEEQARVEALAKQCGLDIVGVIYTDLTPADPTLQDASKAGKVACKRHKDSFFLSGCEVLFAATLQQANASPSRFSRSGRFNSKFVTCVLSGTEDGAIDVSAYQISEQGMAMVKADMIEASVNPNIIRVRPSEGSRYVPEVFYRYKNAYKIDVKESAKPTFPVEYLLVTVTHGFPNEPKPAFLSSSFPIENRPGLHDQDLGRACSAIAQVIGSDDLHPREFGVASDAETRRREKLVGVLSDWHMLCFLDTCGILDADDMKALCRVATTHDAGEALDALLSRTGWQTLSAIAREHAPQGPSAGAVEEKSKIVGDMMGMSGSGGTSARAANPSTPRAAKPAAPAAAPAAPARAPAAAVMGSGRADDPLIYNGDDDDDIELNSDDDDDDELEYADDDMFEDAASSAGAHEVAPARARSPPPPEQDDDMGTAAAGGKACPHCTFINERSSGDCDVCGLPLSG